jgi:hypothetical protein
MPQRTVLVGLLLVVLGVGAYVGTGFGSPTAVLPAALGVPVAVLGRLAAEERRRAATMHAAVVLTLLGALGGLQGVAQLPALLTGGDVERPVAAVVQSAMTAVCAVHVVLAVQSFRVARRIRTAG